MSLGLTVALAVLICVVLTAVVGYVIDRCAEGDEQREKRNDA